MSAMCDHWRRSVGGLGDTPPPIFWSGVDVLFCVPYFLNINIKLLSQKDCLNWRIFTATPSFIKLKSGCVTFHACLHGLFTICNYEVLAKSIVCLTNPTVAYCSFSGNTVSRLIKAQFKRKKLVSKILGESVDSQVPKWRYCDQAPTPLWRCHCIGQHRVLALSRCVIHIIAMCAADNWHQYRKLTLSCLCIPCNRARLNLSKWVCMAA